MNSVDDKEGVCASGIEIDLSCGSCCWVLSEDEVLGGGGLSGNRALRAFEGHGVVSTGRNKLLFQMIRETVAYEVVLDG